MLLFRTYNNYTLCYLEHIITTQSLVMPEKSWFSSHQIKTCFRITKVLKCEQKYQELCHVYLNSTSQISPVCLAHFEATQIPQYLVTALSLYRLMTRYYALQDYGRAFHIKSISDQKCDLSETILTKDFLSVCNRESVQNSKVCTCLSTYLV